MTSTRWMPVAVLSAGVVLLAGCGSSHPAATPASTTTTAAAGSDASTSASTPQGSSGAGSASGACALLTTEQIQQATSNTVADGVPDDSQAASGEQHCDWAMTGTNGSAGLAGTLSVNLETGANAAPNFAALRTASIEKKTITGVGDDAELTLGMNLFVKKGDKVIEITYNGVPSSPVEPILVQLGRQAAAQI